MALVYIPGYITRNDNQPSECKTHFYYEKYGKYTNLTDCGKPKVPSDHNYQWLFFHFILFHKIKEKVCNKSSSNIFMLISEFHFFNMKKKACFYFCKNSFETFLQTWHNQIGKRTSSKNFETSQEWFCFICLYFWDDWLLYTHFRWCLPAFSGSVCQTQ